MKKILLLGMLLAIQSVFGAPSCKNLLDQGAEAYRNGNFDKAVDSWQSCVDQGFQSADLYYNLGNAYFREGRTGFAILYYESALRLDPANEDYRHNLKFVQAMTKDKVENDNDGDNPILNFFFHLHHALSLKAQLYVIIILAWLILLLLVLRILSANPSMKNALFISVFPVAVIFGLISCSAGYKAYIMTHEKKGVVTAASADVMSGPSDEYQTLNMLSEGTIFEVTGIRDGWLQIRLGEKVNGFVKISEAGLVK